MRTDVANSNREPGDDLNSIRETIASTVLAVLETQFRRAIGELNQADKSYLFNIGQLSAGYGTLRAKVLSVLNYGYEL